MAVKGEKPVLDAEKSGQIKLPSGREIPAQGEHSFLDHYGTRHFFFDGRPTKTSRSGFVQLHTYDPKSGDCLIRREGRRPDVLAPNLTVELFGKTANKEAVAVFKNIGGTLDLDLVIKQSNPNHPDGEPQLELRASYQASEWPIRSNDESEASRRNRMWASPRWSAQHLAVKGNKLDSNGHLIESYNFETSGHNRADIHLHGFQENFSRDRLGRLEETKKSFYYQGYLSSATTLTHDPELEDRILLRQKEEILLTHFHSFWADQPQRRIELTNTQNGEIEERYEPLTPKDLQSLKAPDLPRLNDHADVLPAIEPDELKRLFDELHSELGQDMNHRY